MTYCSLIARKNLENLTKLNSVIGVADTSDQISQHDATYLIENSIDQLYEVAVADEATLSGLFSSLSLTYA
jgi:hypothetical protein